MQVIKNKQNKQKKYGIFKTTRQEEEEEGILICHLFKDLSHEWLNILKKKKKIRFLLFYLYLMYIYVCIPSFIYLLVCLFDWLIFRVIK